MIVEARAGTSYKAVLQDSIKKFEKVSERHILDGLGELLTDAQKDWARAKLKEETLFLLKLVLNNEK